jgi:hypothetical protein
MIHNVQAWSQIRQNRIPPIITVLEDRLYALLEKDDLPTVSIEDAAPVLGMGRDQLRRWVQSGECPFGYGWEPKQITKNVKESGYSKVSKLKLWNWHMGR